ncbi:putative zinc-binding metallopeptidase [Crenalkalicoccus roseus]|uniref:putative zinc-binding metallopeptidase n=1 Tax=Crenalkalicoccus roseus TaxID=1485588 RepID=UPI001080C2EC|nr:putative zinc-binding metallopeptidase [Crenalkalicoccus roseus]
MRLFRCQACGHRLHFEERRCGRCGHALGYLPGAETLSALEPDGRAWRALAMPEGRFRYCANADHEACNWLLPARSQDSLCLACRHNRTLPDLAAPENLPPWRRWEEAKRRLIYTLRRLNLPMPDRRQDPARGLAFDILPDPPGGPPVVSRHADGVITLALAEAEAAAGSRPGGEPGGPGSTLLCRLRQQSGHYYWDLLVRDGGRLSAFQAAFAGGRPARARGEEAGDAPREAFARSWAQWLQMLDMLEMAASLELCLGSGEGESWAARGFDPYAAPDAEALAAPWRHLARALEGLNRCAGAPGHDQAAPPSEALSRIGLIHRLAREARGGQGEARP